MLRFGNTPVRLFCASQADFYVGLLAGFEALTLQKTVDESLCARRCHCNETNFIEQLADEYLAAMIDYLHASTVWSACEEHNSHFSYMVA